MLINVLQITMFSALLRRFIFLPFTRKVTMQCLNASLQNTDPPKALLMKNGVKLKAQNDKRKVHKIEW